MKNISKQYFLLMSPTEKNQNRQKFEQPTRQRIQICKSAWLSSLWEAYQWSWPPSSEHQEEWTSNFTLKRVKNKTLRRSRWMLTRRQSTGNCPELVRSSKTSALFDVEFLFLPASFSLSLSSTLLTTVGGIKTSRSGRREKKRGGFADSKLQTTNEKATKRRRRHCTMGFKVLLISYSSTCRRACPASPASLFWPIFTRADGRGHSSW